MKLDLPTPGVPVSPTRSAGRAGGAERGEQRPRRGAVVGAGRFHQRDRARQRPPVAGGEPGGQRRRVPRLTQASPPPAASPLGLRPPFGIPGGACPAPAPARPPPMPIRTRRLPRPRASRRRRRAAPSEASFDFTIAGIRVGTHVARRRAAGDGYAAASASTPPGVIGIFADFYFDGRPPAGSRRRHRRAAPLSPPTLEVAAGARAHPDRVEGRHAGQGLGRAAARAARPTRRSRAARSTRSRRASGCCATAPRRVCDTSVDVFDGSRRSRLALGRPVPAATAIVCAGTYARIEGEAHSMADPREFPFRAGLPRATATARRARADRGADRTSARRCSSGGAEPPAVAAAADRAGPAGARAGARAPPAGPCCRRRPAPARPRGCRSTCSRPARPAAS